MKTTDNTVLITGGSAGIGFAIAKALADKGNKVIITGRNQERIDEALPQLPGAVGIRADVSSEEDTKNLVAHIYENFPQLNIVINNAGQAYKYDIAAQENAFEKAQDEILTNYLSIIRLNEKLLPLLKTQISAALVNVSSVVALVPGQLSTYSASKAALHSYTQSLRIRLERTGDIKVFEIMPPLVNTQLSASINGKTGIEPSQVADEFIEAFENDSYEVRVGLTQSVYELHLKSPEEALILMNPETV